jgi:Transposase
VRSDNSATRTFGTTTRDLLTLVEWLEASQITHVAMESTGVYWKPLYNLLETTGMTVYVVNAAHMKAVPGPKTDVQDAEWICDLMRHGFFPKELPMPPRTLAEGRFNIVRWTAMPTGGHFAALEQPELLARDLRESSAGFAKGVRV